MDRNKHGQSQDAQQAGTDVVPHYCVYAAALLKTSVAWSGDTACEGSSKRRIAGHFKQGRDVYGCQPFMGRHTGSRRICVSMQHCIDTDCLQLAGRHPLCNLSRHRCTNWRGGITFACRTLEGPKELKDMMLLDMIEREAEAVAWQLITSPSTHWISEYPRVTALRLAKKAYRALPVLRYPKRSAIACSPCKQQAGEGEARHR